MNIGITLIIALLIPILYQITTFNLYHKKRHLEILHRMNELEMKMDAIISMLQQQLEADNDQETDN
jgi:hypothetical protein